MIITQCNHSAYAIEPRGHETTDTLMIKYNGPVQVDELYVRWIIQFNQVLLVDTESKTWASLDFYFMSS